jgi:hypothetical protein
MALIEKKNPGQLPVKEAADLNTATDLVITWSPSAPSGSRTGTTTLNTLASLTGTAAIDQAIDAFRAEPDPLPQYALEASLGSAALASTVSLLDRANHTGTQAISTVTGLQRHSIAKSIARYLLPTSQAWMLPKSLQAHSQTIAFLPRSLVIAR